MGELCKNCQLSDKCEAMRDATTVARIASKASWNPSLRAKAFGAIGELYPDCPQKEMIQRLGQITPPPRT